MKRDLVYERSIDAILQADFLRAFDEMARFRRSNLQYLIMSHARHGPRGISPWTVWQTPKGNYTISSANTIPRRVWLKE
jgi:hypothetical protein